MKTLKEKRDMVVTIRFTQKEIELIAEMIKDRNRELPKAEWLSLSEYLREKLLVLDRNLELKQIRMGLTDIDAQMHQIRMYLSKKGEAAKESFMSEVLASIEAHLDGLRAVFDEEADDGCNST